MKRYLLLICSIFSIATFAQVVDSVQLPPAAGFSASHVQDSLPLIDSMAAVDSVSPTLSNNRLSELLKENFLIKNHTAAKSYRELRKERSGREFDFYYVLCLFAFAGFLRTMYPRYFANMFRVFFNTSLRQGQLTDQLLQARLTSMLFNLFFVFSTGFFIYQLLLFSDVISRQKSLKVLLLITAALTIMYSGKYFIVKFTGWISGFSKEAETYVFIVFLVNKILGIALLPLSLVLTFSAKGIAGVAAITSLMIILVLFLLRFFRSYGILQQRIKVNRLHFFLYIIGVEILPLLLIYKSAVDLLLKNA